LKLILLKRTKKGRIGKTNIGLFLQKTAYISNAEKCNHVYDFIT